MLRVFDRGYTMEQVDKAVLTCRANSGTGSQEGRPRTRPRELHSSDIRTGFGAVALYVPSKSLFCTASMYRFTRSSLHNKTAFYANNVVQA